MTDSIDQLDKLEQKLLKAVELFKKTQAERRALQLEIEKLPEDYKDRLKRAETLEREVQALRGEREEVRNRIEKLLDQIEILTKTESAG